jgi:hypothetical protein
VYSVVSNFDINDVNTVAVAGLLSFKRWRWFLICSPAFCTYCITVYIKLYDHIVRTVESQFEVKLVRYGKVVRCLGSPEVPSIEVPPTVTFIGQGMLFNSPYTHAYIKVVAIRRGYPWPYTCMF